MLITTDGLITRSYATGDGDHVIHLVTPARGRIAVMVKKGRGKKNPFAAITQPFTYGNYELYRGSGDLYWLKGGSVIKSFYSLTEDLTSMALASYICDVTSEFSDEGESAEEILQLSLNTLYALMKQINSHAIIKAVFELRAATVTGFMPDLSGCCACGEANPVNAYLDIMNGSVICADCRTKRNRHSSGAAESTAESGQRNIISPMTASTLAAVRYAVHALPKKIFSFTLADKEEESIFSRVAETYLLHHAERGFDTLSFYHSVEV